MKCKFINVLMFAAGAAVGSAVTWRILKTKYERIVQEELDSIKEVFSDHSTTEQEQDDESVEDDDDLSSDNSVTHIDWSDLEDLDEEEEDFDASTLNEYTKLSNNYTNKKGGADDMEKEPYVISPYDFGELDDYSQIELTYYADGTLEDEDYNIVTDVDELIGPKALSTFGEYEDDSVFVRNDRLRTDFQILKDYRTYAKARSVGPNRVGDE